MIVLQKYSPFPPGGFPYKQTDGLEHYFPDIGLDIVQQGNLVLAFRLGNRLPRASLQEVVADIDVYTCVRLKGSGCIDSDAPIPIPAPRSGGCSSCGGPHAP